MNTIAHCCVWLTGHRGPCRPRGAPPADAQRAGEYAVLRAKIDDATNPDVIGHILTIASGAFALGLDGDVLAALESA